jgi:hypothetical protein
LRAAGPPLCHALLFLPGFPICRRPFLPSPTKYWQVIICHILVAQRQRLLPPWESFFAACCSPLLVPAMSCIPCSSLPTHFIYRACPFINLYLAVGTLLASQLRNECWCCHQLTNFTAAGKPAIFCSTTNVPDLLAPLHPISSSYTWPVIPLIYTLPWSSVANGAAAPHSAGLGPDLSLAGPFASWNTLQCILFFLAGPAGTVLLNTLYTFAEPCYTIQCSLPMCLTDFAFYCGWSMMALCLIASLFNLFSFFLSACRSLFHHHLEWGQGLLRGMTSSIVFCRVVVRSLAAFCISSPVSRARGGGIAPRLICRVLLNACQLTIQKFLISWGSILSWLISRMVMMGKWSVHGSGLWRIYLKYIFQFIHPFLEASLTSILQMEFQCESCWKLEYIQNVFSMKTAMTLKDKSQIYSLMTFALLHL